MPTSPTLPIRQGPVAAPAVVAAHPGTCTACRVTVRARAAATLRPWAPEPPSRPPRCSPPTRTTASCRRGTSSPAVPVDPAGHRVLRSPRSGDPGGPARPGHRRRRSTGPDVGASCRGPGGRRPVRLGAAHPRPGRAVLPRSRGDPQRRLRRAPGRLDRRRRARDGATAGPAGGTRRPHRPPPGPGRRHRARRPHRPVRRTGGRRALRHPRRLAALGRRRSATGRRAGRRSLGGVARPPAARTRRRQRPTDSIPKNRRRNSRRPACYATQFDFLEGGSERRVSRPDRLAAEVSWPVDVAAVLVGDGYPGTGRAGA